MKKTIITSLLAISFMSCEGLFFEEPSPEEIPTLDSFFQEIERHYSYFDVIAFEGFEEEYSEQRIILSNNPTRIQLITCLQSLVDILRDGHTDVFGSTTISYEGWFEPFPLNQLDDISSYFSYYSVVNSALEYGRIEGQDIGYLRVRTFSGGIDFAPIADIVEELSNTSSIIIDVRSNGGGSSQNADLVVSHFNDQSRLQFRQRQRIGGLTDYGPWFEKFTEANRAPTFIKPTFVLTNRKCFSATEWFITGMMTIPYVRIVGDTTGGGSGNPILKELPNGWSMRTSNTQKQLPSGTDFQFTGLYPDIPVWISEEDSIQGLDTILEKAIELATN